MKMRFGVVAVLERKGGFGGFEKGRELCRKVVFRRTSGNIMTHMRARAHVREPLLSGTAHWRVKMKTAPRPKGTFRTLYIHTHTHICNVTLQKELCDRFKRKRMERNKGEGKCTLASVFDLI